MSHNPASLTAEQRKAIRKTMVPECAVCATHKGGLYTVYYYEDASGRPCARAFVGKALKLAFRIQFRTHEARARYCRKFADRLEQREADKAARRSKANAGHSLEVGAVLKSVWGYEQTNVNYYEVTKLIGKTMVEVRAIAQAVESDAHMQGACAPKPGHYIGEPKRRKVSFGDMVRINQCQRAHLQKPTAIVGGKPVYGTDRWTAYH